jgi:4-carboxymuconolactone decarboxylase
VDYTDRLRRLAINDARVAEDSVDGADVESGGLDPRDLALVRLAALVAAGGTVPSFGAQADAAVSAGATAAEIVDVLVGVVPIVGLPRVVAAAPNLAMALAARAHTP